VQVKEGKRDVKSEYEGAMQCKRRGRDSQREESSKVR
jgi:hypothetical protein